MTTPVDQPSEVERVESLLTLVSENHASIMALLRQHLEQVSARSAEDASRAQIMLAEMKRVEISLRAASVRFGVPTP